MADNRSRRQKLEAVIAPGSGATEGERRNARSLLAKMKPEPAPVRPRQPGVKIHYRTEWTVHRTRGDLGNLTYDQLMELLRRQMYDYEAEVRRYTSPFGPQKDHPFGDPYKPKINCFGLHDWVVIGESMFHTEIKRCTTCGEFDPPRRKPDGP